MDANPEQIQLKKNPLHMPLPEPVELTPARLFTALCRPVLGITEDFQEKFEANIQLPTKVHAKQKEWKWNPQGESIIIMLSVKKK